MFCSSENKISDALASFGSMEDTGKIVTQKTSVVIKKWNFTTEKKPTKG